MPCIYRTVRHHHAVCHFIEDTFGKYRKEKVYRNLLLTLHNTLRHNFLLVLSLAAGSKENIDRVRSLVATGTVANSSYIRIGEREKARQYLLDWYSQYNYPSLTILDPYFDPYSLDIIKDFCDINNDLSITILCQGGRYTKEDYLDAWKKLSSGVTNNVTIYFARYKSTNDEGPVHDRITMCSDEDSGERHALTHCSYNGFGNKESWFNDVSAENMQSASDTLMRYVLHKPRKVDDHEMVYGNVELD